MFRRDPVAIVLGRDVAQLVHRINHREALKEVIAEYHRRVTLSDNGMIALDDCTFNWRRHLKAYYSTCVRGVWSSSGIYNQRGLVVGTLPKNY